MTNLEYATVRGNLGAFRKLPEGSRWQTAVELQTDRCQDGQINFQKDWFWLPHGNVFYTGKDGKLGWGFTDQKRNLILKYIDNALTVLPDTGIFQPEAAESKKAITHKSTQRFVYDDLGLIAENSEWSYFCITSDNSPEQQRAAQATGFTERNLNYLLGKGLRPRLWLPNSEYLAKVFSGTEGKAKDPIWRASALYNFDYYSYFSAIGHLVDSHGRFRGVRRRALLPAGDAPEKSDVPSAPSEISPARCYEFLLANPAEAAKALDDKTASGLSGLLTRYLTTRGQ